jgi:hypothetical protein
MINFKKICLVFRHPASPALHRLYLNGFGKNLNWHTCCFNLYIMKSKIAALGLISLILVGCGSNNNLSTAPVADTGNTSNVSIPSGSTGYPAPFGTAIYTPFFPSGQSTLDNTFMFTETETVVEGDVVVVDQCCFKRSFYWNRNEFFIRSLLGKCSG